MLSVTISEAVHKNLGKFTHPSGSSRSMHMSTVGLDGRGGDNIGELSDIGQIQIAPLEGIRDVSFG